MKITQQHIDFYRAKKTPALRLQASLKPLSSFAKRMSVLYRPTAVIDLLINSQTDEKRTTEPHNILSILRSMRSRKRDLLIELQRMAYTPYSTDPKRRTAYCRKWHRRLSETRTVKGDL